jgi:hypothetical protein
MVSHAPAVFTVPSVQSYMFGSFMLLSVGNLGSSGGIVKRLRAWARFPAGTILHACLRPIWPQPHNNGEIFSDSDAAEL